VVELVIRCARVYNCVYRKWDGRHLLDGTMDRSPYNVHRQPALPTTLSAGLRMCLQHSDSTQPASVGARCSWLRPWGDVQLSLWRARRLWRLWADAGSLRAPATWTELHQPHARRARRFPHRPPAAVQGILARRRRSLAVQYLSQNFVTTLLLASISEFLLERLAVNRQVANCNCGPTLARSSRVGFVK